MTSESAEKSPETTQPKPETPPESTPESIVSEDVSDDLSDDLLQESKVSEIDPTLQVRLKSAEDQLQLILPTQGQMSVSEQWSEIWLQLKQRLMADRFWQAETPVCLMAQDQLLDTRQLQAIAEALDEFQLRLKRVSTSRRQTAVAAATAGYSVEQQPLSDLLSATPAESTKSLAEPLYLQTTVRSGVDVRHPGSVIVMGDLNPGGTIVAAGDILVWGRLRGVAHAGVQGNRDCRIMALKLEPTQLRIADLVARAPETPPNQFEPEVAYVTDDGIRITKAFVK